MNVVHQKKYVVFTDLHVMVFHFFYAKNVWKRRRLSKFVTHTFINFIEISGEYAQ